MKRATVILLLLACLVCMGGAFLALVTAAGYTAVSGWFAACICTGVLGMVLDDTPADSEQRP